MTHSGEALDEKRQRSLIANFYSKVPDEVSDFRNDKATVTSALPLTDNEKANIKKVLSGTTMDFKVNPSILGGLIIRSGNQVIDNSVGRKLEYL